MSTVRTRIKNETNSGNRRGWSKHVTSVDSSKTNGYAFLGEFIADNTETELPIGAVIVQKHPEGSVKHSWESGHVYRLGSDGELYETNGKSYDWRKEFLSFRDQVAAALTLTDDPAAPTTPTPETVPPAESATVTAPDARAAALAQIRELMAAHGITADDLR